MKQNSEDLFEEAVPLLYKLLSSMSTIMGMKLICSVCVYVV